MEESVRRTLERIGREFSTPSYAYFLDDIVDQISRLRELFDSRFEISYAVKSNPNKILMKHIREHVDLIDVSSGGELDAVIEAGYEPGRISFSGPAKRETELARAVALADTKLVCESGLELDQLNELAGARGMKTPILFRINPMRVPKSFGISMAGSPSPFGFDEEHLDDYLGRLDNWPNLVFKGFHVYSGTNSLDPNGIAENFSIFIELFQRFSATHNLSPEWLIFGAGFGIPYSSTQNPLDTQKLAALICPLLDDMRNSTELANSRCVLETGRYLVGPYGYFLTRILNEKRSRDREIRICDGGMNNHLAACGLMGMILRRPWPMWKVNGADDESIKEYTLTGPLCTTIDTLAQNVKLPELHRGDLVAIGSSGAYGLTSSPNRFISHPEPKEFLVTGRGNDTDILDITE